MELKLLKITSNVCLKEVGPEGQSMSQTFSLDSKILVIGFFTIIFTGLNNAILFKKFQQVQIHQKYGSTLLFSLWQSVSKVLQSCFWKDTVHKYLLTPDFVGNKTKLGSRKAGEFWRHLKSWTFAQKKIQKLSQMRQERHHKAFSKQNTILVLSSITVHTFKHQCRLIGLEVTWMEGWHGEGDIWGGAGGTTLPAALPQGALCSGDMGQLWHFWWKPSAHWWCKSALFFWCGKITLCFLCFFVQSQEQYTLNITCKEKSSCSGHEIYFCVNDTFPSFGREEDYEGPPPPCACSTSSLPPMYFH